MKKIILFLLLAVTLGSCGKSDPVTPTETKQGLNIEFVKDKQLTGGQTVEEPFNVNVVLIWKADGKDFKYNGTSDGKYAYDNIGKESFKSDYEFVNIRNLNTELPAGKYFITIITNDKENPKLAYSYTTFTVATGTFSEIKKNVTSMENYKYTAW